jgi:hypothetical protein
MRTNSEFDRWTPIHETCFPYIVFKKYATELKRLDMSYEASRRYTYSQLKKEGALWDDKASKFLYTNKNDEITIKNWSNTFEDFDNWFRLNKLLAMSSYFETYIAAITSLSLESDPGLLIGCPHCIDGIKLKKTGISPISQDDMKEHLKRCTKGDWMSRTSYMKKLFGEIPQSLSEKLSELEKIRNLRNKIGHAFGRDIEDARDTTIITIQPMERLTKESYIRFQHIIDHIARDINNELMKNHIGNYQHLSFYHKKFDELSKYDIKNRTKALKKMYGQDINNPISKKFCDWIINYYQTL